MNNSRSDPPRWLLLLHQLPASAAKGRVRIWRRLQQIGALAVRGSAYVLPHSPHAVEHFEWLRAEIIGLGGTASLFEGQPLDPQGDAEMVKKFRELRAGEYEQLMADVRALSHGRASRTRGGNALSPAFAPQVRGLRARLQKIAAGDPIGGPLKDDAVRAITALERQLAPRAASATADRLAAPFVGRTWVTRPRPGVDRMSSAWLIRTFIDPAARFVFADTPGHQQVAFDMFEGDFTHQGSECTFEILVRHFRIGDPSVRRMADVVHDLDLNDGRYNHPETATIDMLVDGIRESQSDDALALETGMALFGALYRGFLGQAAPGRRAESRRRTTQARRRGDNRKGARTRR